MDQWGQNEVIFCRSPTEMKMVGPRCITVVVFRAFGCLIQMPVVMKVGRFVGRFVAQRSPEVYSLRWLPR